MSTYNLISLYFRSVDLPLLDKFKKLADKNGKKPTTIFRSVLIDYMEKSIKDGSIKLPE